MKPLILFLLLALPLAAAPSYLTYDNTPMGSEKQALLLRTYMPDPGIEDAVFANHGKGTNSPRYNVGQGKDVGGEYKPIKGIPAAIAVNQGASLSYCFDTTECRLLYAWQGGFLDMYPYWGDRGRGNRQSFNYVPHLIGNLFHKAAGKHPLSIDGKPVSELGAPKFLGFVLDRSKAPIFRVKFGSEEVVYLIRPSETALSLKLVISSPNKKPLSYRDPSGRTHQSDQGLLKMTLTGTVLAAYQGFPRDLGVKNADPASGKKLYLNLGCIACHSLDGSKSHGPTFAKLFSNERTLADGSKVVADDAYLLESIKKPNAKIAKGFPPSYMPPYQLKDIEYQALVAFLKSIDQPE